MKRFTENIRRRMHEDKGLTLVEVLLVTVLIGLVLSVSYSLYFFGTSAFSRGETQSVLQQKVRVAASRVVEEVRFAWEVEFIDLEEEAVPAPSEDTSDPWQYIYVEPESGHLVHQTASGTRTILDEAEPALTFNRAGDRILKIDLSADLQGTTYRTETEVLILNLVENLPEPISDAEPNTVAIGFSNKKP